MRRILAAVTIGVLFVGCEEEPAPPQNVAKPAPVAEGVARGGAKTEQARTGMGAKAQRIGEGMIASPVAAGFRAQETINFGLVKHNLELYKAMHGEYPKNQTEFNELIVKANQIALPELPEGDRYVYDPQKGQLLVEHHQ